MKLEELLKYKPNDPRLKKHRFTTNEVLSLIRGLSKLFVRGSSAPMVENAYWTKFDNDSIAKELRGVSLDVKEDWNRVEEYLQLLRDCKSHSSVAATKYAKHFSEAIKEKDATRLLNYFIFMVNNVDAENPEGKKEFEDFIKEIKENKIGFLRTMLGGYEDDGRTYKGKARKEYIKTDLAQFLQDNDIFPNAEEAKEILMSASLSEGARLIEFFVDSKIFPEGFPHNVFVKFLDQFSEKQIAKVVDKFVDLKIKDKGSEEDKDKIREEELRAVLKGRGHFYYQKHHYFMRLFLKTESAKKVVKELSKEELLKDDVTKEKFGFVLNFINLNLTFVSEELRVFFQDIKLKKPDIYLEVIYSLKDKIIGNARDYLPEITLSDLAWLGEKLFPSSYSSSPLKTFVQHQLSKVENEVMIEFLSRYENGKYSSQLALSLSQTFAPEELQSGIEKSIANGSILGLDGFVKLAAKAATKKESKKQLYENVLKLMIESNLDPARKAEKPLFVIQDFSLILENLEGVYPEIKLDSNLMLSAICSCSQNSFVSEGQNFEVKAEELLKKVDGAVIEEDVLRQILTRLILERSSSKEVFAVLDNCAGRGYSILKPDGKKVVLSHAEIQKTYLEILFKIFVENSDNPNFEASQVNYAPKFCKFGLEQIYKTALSVKAASANPNRGFSLALIGLVQNGEVLHQSKVKLSLLLEFADSFVNCENELAKSCAIKLLSQTSFENDCDESSDDPVLALMRNIVAINKDQPNGFSYQNFFREIFCETENKQLSTAGRRIIAKMDLAQRLIFLDEKDIKIEQGEDVLAALLNLAQGGKNPNILHLACSNFVKIIKANKDKKFISASANQESLLALLKAVIAQDVNIRSEEILQIFKAVAPDFKGFSEVKDFSFAEGFDGDLARFAKILSMLQQCGFAIASMEAVKEMDAKTAAQIFIKSSFIKSIGLLSTEAREALVREVLMPKILAGGDLEALLVLKEALKDRDNVEKIILFQEMSNYLKVGLQNRPFWAALEKIECLNGKPEDKLIFVLNACKVDSAPLEMDLNINGIKIVGLEQIKVLFAFFPGKILKSHIPAIAKQDGLVEYLNEAMKFMMPNLTLRK